MKLINTDGMVFFGPGSEWLWMALTGLVLAGTGVAIYRQLRVQQLQIHDNTKLLRSQAHYNAMLLAMNRFTRTRHRSSPGSLRRY